MHFASVYEEKKKKNTRKSKNMFYLANSSTNIAFPHNNGIKCKYSTQFHITSEKTNKTVVNYVLIANKHFIGVAVSQYASYDDVVRKNANHGLSISINIMIHTSNITRKCLIWQSIVIQHFKTQQNSINVFWSIKYGKILNRL